METTTVREHVTFRQIAKWPDSVLRCAVALAEEGRIDEIPLSSAGPSVLGLGVRETDFLNDVRDELKRRRDSHGS